MKRMTLVVFAMLLMLGAIDASASCRICRPSDDACVIRLDGALGCDYTFGFCQEVGVCPPGFAPTAKDVPMASQWTVASVERLDQPTDKKNSQALAQPQPQKISAQR